jgi:hypothetical protein
VSAGPEPAASAVVGRYEIIRRIGRGGMATVHLARQPDLDRNVALKELDRLSSADDGVLAARFLQEARLAGKLSHPNVVTVFEYFEHDARPFIAMEHVEGGSLRDYLGDLTLGQIAGVLEGLLASLTHAEQHEVVHRDLKPENILVTGDGRVKITDFGIAKAYNAVVGGSLLTATGTTIGTPTYMAPEQATGRPLGAATDLYSVGVVAYEMLTGRVPFASDEGALAIVWQHVHEPFPDPRLLVPDLDPRLCAWLEHLLAKDLGERPASPAAAYEELEEIVLDLLGGRWRRDAPLATPHSLPGTRRPLTPARVEAPPPAQEVAPRDDAPRDEARQEELAQPPTIAPLRLRGGTELFARPHRNARPDDALDPAARRRPAAIVAAVVLVVLAAVAGFALLSSPEDPVPRAPKVAPPAPPESRIADRFGAALAPLLTKLDRVRVDGRRELAAVKLASRQAAQARRIARAYRTAAQSLAALAPAARQRDAAALLGDKLTRAGQAYDALARAASARNRADFNAARGSIPSREAAVRRAAALVPG